MSQMRRVATYNVLCDHPSQPQAEFQLHTSLPWAFYVSEHVKSCLPEINTNKEIKRTLGHRKKNPQLLFLGTFSVRSSSSGSWVVWQNEFDQATVCHRVTVKTYVLLFLKAQIHISWRQTLSYLCDRFRERQCLLLKLQHEDWYFCSRHPGNRKHYFCYALFTKRRYNNKKHTMGRQWQSIHFIYFF
jgi:hypothetical protein